MINEQDGWSTDGRNIFSPDRLSAIRKVIEEIGPVIVEHWFYYGSRSPDRLIFGEYEEFLAYVTTKGIPGDAFHVWNFADVCRDENTIANGKRPDEQGRVPARGAY